jgi:hypothetical protein
MPIRGQPVVRESMMQSFLGLGAATASAQSGISLSQMPSNSSSNPFNWVLHSLKSNREAELHPAATYQSSTVPTCWKQFMLF